jgi:AhpD family alkylhydroperoxidase
MDGRSRFPRPTASAATLAPWLGELARTFDGLVGSYLPGQVIDPRTRERVILAVTEVNGSRWCAWVHGSWSQFLGEDDPDSDVTDALLSYARASAEAGRPLDPAPLAEVLPPAAARSLRATVAQIGVSNLVANTADGLVARLTGKRPADPFDTLGEVAIVALAAPLAAPFLAAAGLMRVATRMAPPVPTIETPEGEANLLVHLLVQAAPGPFANVAVRTVVARLPVTLAVALRAGRSAATVRFGRGRVEVVNGVQADALVVIEGDIEPLLRAASGVLAREMGTLRIRPS